MKNKLVGVRGFEPPTPASRRQCSTRLSYTPNTDASVKSEPQILEQPSNCFRYNYGWREVIVLSTELGPVAPTRMMVKLM